MDWKDLKRTDRVKVYQVSPQNIDTIIGELDGADLSSASLDFAYYSDTRTSGKLSVVGEGWQRGAFLRIVHEVPEWDYARELGTYIVTSDNADRANGAWVYELELQSILYALDLDCLLRPWTIAQNAMARKAVSQLVGQTNFKLIDTGNDYKVKSTLVLDSGTSRLSALFALSQLANNRIDVDGHGRITIGKYIVPASKAASFRIDLADPDGIALDGLSRSTNWLEMPDTVGVAHRYTDSANREREINASATVGSGSHQAKAVRGYSIVDFREISDMSPKTAARAQQIANQYLAADTRELVEWELETTFLPITEGDVVELVVHDGDSDYQGIRKCLVKAQTIDLSTMRMRLTLKETASGDDE